MQDKKKNEAVDRRVFLSLFRDCRLVDFCRKSLHDRRRSVYRICRSIANSNNKRIPFARQYRREQSYKRIQAKVSRVAHNLLVSQKKGQKRLLNY